MDKPIFPIHATRYQTNKTEALGGKNPAPKSTLKAKTNSTSMKDQKNRQIMIFFKKKTTKVACM